MDIIFSFFSLFGGLAFFLYGMNIMSTGLEKLAGSKLEQMLRRMTSNPLKALFLGVVVTTAIQSSSAVTVMLVGLVNSGIMELPQTVGVIMGSNIGTTMTAWILSLAGIEADGNFFIHLIKPENFSPLLALIGLLLTMMAKSNRQKSMGSILLGFALLMYGMELMKDSMAPLTDSPKFASIMTAFNNPVFAVAAGAILTAIIQSSSASVGILQALATTSNISYGMAIPIIMGQNIGTCITAVISAIGVSKNARKVSVIHLSFNLIGTALCLGLFYGANAMFTFAFTELPVEPWSIAVIHSVFNIFVTIILLPFNKQLVKLADVLVRSGESERQHFLDDRLLSTPSIAISECNNLTIKMAQLAEETLTSAMNMAGNYAYREANTIRASEDFLDRYEDELGTYLVKLSGKDLSDADNRKVSKLLHTIGDFERLGDHALNLLDGAEEIYDKKITFSGDAQRELGVLSNAIRNIMTLTVEAFTNDDLEKAKRVEPLEQVIDLMIADIKIRHIERLRAGNCTIELGFILSDMLNNYERISDHCSNIAVAIIELGHDSFQTHEYLNAVKTGDSEFNALFAEYQAQYQL